MLGEDGQCDHLDRTVNWKILPGLQIPLVQGVLFNAEWNVELPAGSPDEDVATGHIVATAIEPLVSAVNATAASIIARNFDFNLSHKPVNDGAKAIYEAFAHTLRGMGVNCNDIGVSTTDPNLKVCDEEVAAPHQDTPTKAIQWISYPRDSDGSTLSRALRELARRACAASKSTGFPSIRRSRFERPEYGFRRSWWCGL